MLNGSEGIKRKEKAMKTKTNMKAGMRVA
jgi:hypothetical protein